MGFPKANLILLKLPGFSAEAAEFLVAQRRVKALGIDTLNIDAFVDFSFPAHYSVLGEWFSVYMVCGRPVKRLETLNTVCLLLCWFNAEGEFGCVYSLQRLSEKCSEPLHTSYLLSVSQMFGSFSCFQFHWKIACILYLALILHWTKLNFVKYFSGRNLPAYENLDNLHKLPEYGATVGMLPMKIKEGSGGPIRAFAIGWNGPDDPCRLNKKEELWWFGIGVSLYDIASDVFAM